METASERRKRKLAELCEKHGGPAAIAAKAGVNPASLDQVLKGVLLPAKADGSRSPRSLGDAAARLIEAAYRLPAGWFDSPDMGADSLSVAAMAVARAYEKMTPMEKVRFEHLMAAAVAVPPDDSAWMRERNLDSALGDFDTLPENKNDGKHLSTEAPPLAQGNDGNPRKTSGRRS